MEQNKSRFPEQDQPEKKHGTTDESGQPPKMNTDVKKTEKNESTHLTDRSGEEENGYETKRLHDESELART